MRLSTPNQLAGTIVEVTLGTVMATVKVRLHGGDQVVTASITDDAAMAHRGRLSRRYGPKSVHVPMMRILCDRGDDPGPQRRRPTGRQR